MIFSVHCWNESRKLFSWANPTRWFPIPGIAFFFNVVPFCRLFPSRVLGHLNLSLRRFSENPFSTF